MVLLEMSHVCLHYYQYDRAKVKTIGGLHSGIFTDTPTIHPHPPTHPAYTHTHTYERQVDVFVVP